MVQPAASPSGNNDGVQTTRAKPIYKNRIFLAAVIVVILVIVGVVALGGGGAAYPTSVQSEFLKGLETGSGHLDSQDATCILKWFESNVPLTQLEKEGQQNNSSVATSQGVRAALACNLGSSSTFGNSGLGGLGILGNSGNSGILGNSGNSGNTGNSGNSGNTGNSGNSGNSGNTGNSGNSGNTDNSGNSGNTGN